MVQIMAYHLEILSEVSPKFVPPQGDFPNTIPCYIGPFTMTLYLHKLATVEALMKPKLKHPHWNTIGFHPVWDFHFKFALNPHQSSFILNNLSKSILRLYDTSRTEQICLMGQAVCLLIGHNWYSPETYENSTLKHSHWTTGPWFNIKMPSYQYRKSHCGDKTVVRSSYLYNGISYTGKMAFLYWISPLFDYILLGIFPF